MNKDLIDSLARIVDRANRELSKIALGKANEAEVRDALLAINFYSARGIDALQGLDSFVGFDAYTKLQEEVARA